MAKNKPPVLDMKEDIAWKQISTPDLDAWWIPEPGRVLIGTIIAVSQFNDDEGKVRPMYLVENRDALTAKPVGEENLAEVPAGSVIAVVQSHALAKLEEIAAWYERPMVRIESVEKKKLKGSRHMWKYTIHMAGGTKRAARKVFKFSELPTPIEQRGQANNGSDNPSGIADDDIPF